MFKQLSYNSFCINHQRLFIRIPNSTKTESSQLWIEESFLISLSSDCCSCCIYICRLISPQNGCRIIHQIYIVHINSYQFFNLVYLAASFTVTLNLSPPSAAYMRQWIMSTLVHIMACCLYSAKPLSKPMLGYCQLNKLQWNFNQNIKIFIHENASENIFCKMIRGRWVKSLWPSGTIWQPISKMKLKIALSK